MSEKQHRVFVHKKHSPAWEGLLLCLPPLPSRLPPQPPGKLGSVPIPCQQLIMEIISGSNLIRHSIKLAEKA